jgi:acyl carrier protein
MNAQSDTMRERIIALTAKVLKIDPKTIRAADRFREDLGMDSLASLELLSCISDEMDLDFELDEAMQMQTVDDAAAFVTRKLQDKK